jgi:hypothetical protein
MSKKKSYKLQWTKIYETGRVIPVEEFEYTDVNDKVYASEEEAMEDRMQIMLRTPGWYIKVVPA